MTGVVLLLTELASFSDSSIIVNGSIFRVSKEPTAYRGKLMTAFSEHSQNKHKDYSKHSKAIR